MSAIKYPDGSMRSYQRKPLNSIFHKNNVKRKIKQHFAYRYNKYNARKPVIDGIKFDSNAEGYFYLMLKRSKHTNYVYHKKYLLKPHAEFTFRGHLISIMKRSYTPDFLIYKNNKSHIRKNLLQIIDVKGQPHITGSANRQMDDFTRQYLFPVTIARYDRKKSRHSGKIVFDEQLRGVKKSGSKKHHRQVKNQTKLALKKKGLNNK